jgi:hypothetical protein
MANRSWFFAHEGKQQGPYPEDQLRDLIARGAIGHDTLVWTEGMANWQRAGEVPGLMPAGMPPPPPPLRSGGQVALAGGALSIDFGIWDWIWRHVVLVIGVLLIIPAPWVVAMYCRWIVSCVRVPGRPDLSFTGRATTLMWYYAILLGMIVIVVILSLPETARDAKLADWASMAIQILMYWLVIRWFIANLASNGQPLGLTFNGSYWVYLGWNIAVVLAWITIIGWAWVWAAQIRWMCRQVGGTRREIVFKATGLEVLWRGLVTFIACMFVIPIPWAIRWFIRWQVSQVALVERGAYAA